MAKIARFSGGFDIPLSTIYSAAQQQQFSALHFVCRKAKTPRVDNQQIHESISLEGSLQYNAASQTSHPLPFTSFTLNSSISRRMFLSGIVAASLITNANAATIDDIVELNLPRFFRTQTGVTVEDVVEGFGLEAKEGDTVEFNYVCRRTNGYFVYSTINQFSGESSPISLTLGSGKNIRGLEEVIQGMRSGGKRRAIIPPELGYVKLDLEPQPQEFGPKRSLISHAKEPLIFEVQVLRVT